VLELDILYGDWGIGLLKDGCFVGLGKSVILEIAVWVVFLRIVGRAEMVFMR
jgi:hypothetical protein